MDVHCTTCGEPRDVYHLRHAEVRQLLQFVATNAQPFFLEQTVPIQFEPNSRWMRVEVCGFLDKKADKLAVILKSNASDGKRCHTLSLAGFNCPLTRT